MDKNEANRLRLEGLVKLFNLSLTDIAKVVGVSRPLISRILSGDIHGNGIYTKLEQHLPELVAKRRQSLFSVDGVEIEKIQEMVKCAHTQSDT